MVQEISRIYSSCVTETLFPRLCLFILEPVLLNYRGEQIVLSVWEKGFQCSVPDKDHWTL